MWLELTTLLIPEENDSVAELEAMTGWVVEHLGPDVPMHFTAFHPDWKMTHRPPTPLGTLARAREIALEAGVRHPYIGNLRDRTGASTRCHLCGQTLIGRDGYRLLEWNLTDRAACHQCGTAVAGVFEARPGDWGNRRRPVRLRALEA